jgi:hypothetical protein
MTLTQFKLIKAGLSAGSSHNMQPWLVDIEDEVTFSLYIDANKVLNVVDKNFKQLLMSQGTFVGKVILEAKNADIDIQIIYEDIDEIVSELNKITKDSSKLKVATFKLISDPLLDPDVVSSGTYQDSEVQVANIEEIIEEVMRDTFEVSGVDGNNIIVQGFSNEYIHNDNSVDLVAQFQAFLREATAIEAGNEAALEEMIHVFRFSRWDKNKYRYGLSLNTMSPYLQIFVEPIMDLTSNSKTFYKTFGDSSISAFEDRLSDEESYILIKKENPSPMDYIITGELMSELSDELDGYTIRPAVQLLEEIDGMERISHSFQSEYGHGDEVLLILGVTKRSESSYESIRHKVQDIIMIRG